MDYARKTYKELVIRKKELEQELDRINHAMRDHEAHKWVMKDLLWSRYLEFKEETGCIIVVEYLGGNSMDKTNYEYYKAKEIQDPNYETEISKDYLYWLNRNRELIDNVDSFEWMKV